MNNRTAVSRRFRLQYSLCFAVSCMFSPFVGFCLLDSGGFRGGFLLRLGIAFGIGPRTGWTPLDVAFQRGSELRLEAGQLLDDLRCLLAAAEVVVRHA